MAKKQVVTVDVMKQDRENWKRHFSEGWDSEQLSDLMSKISLLSSKQFQSIRGFIESSSCFHLPYLTQIELLALYELDKSAK